MKRFVAKFLLCLAVGFSAAGMANAQVTEVKQVVFNEAKQVESTDESDPIFQTSEQKPCFPGGDAAMFRFLAQNLVYPADAVEDGVSGKVLVQFVVEKDGSVSGAKVVKGKHPSLDAEAVRVVGKMPRWTPGRNNGVVVRVAYTVPVSFRLQ